MKTLTLSLLSALVLSACGGSSSSSGSQNAVLNLGISDAPVDSATEVVLYFNQVVLVPQDGSDPILVNVQEDGASGRVDLLDFQGANQSSLISALTLPPGDYTMCLYALDGDGSTDLSYVNDADQGIVPLVVKSKGSCSGVSGDTADAGRIFFNQPFTLNVGENNFVAEFDLRKGLVDPKGQDEFFIKPTAVQLVNSVESGNLTGTVDDTLIDACIADTVTQAGDGTPTSAVYLFASGTELAQMGDVDNERDAFVQPIAVAAVNPVEVEGVTQQQYEFGFVAEGTYSLGYTCLAQNDLTESDDLGDEAGQISFYQAYGPVTIIAGQTVTQPLAAVEP